MITIDASGATSGMDFEAFIRGGFIADATGGGFPVFDNSPDFAGEEMLIGYGSDPSSKYVLAHGSLEYAFATHTVAGTINTIQYGTRGSGAYDSDGYFTGGNAELTITGLDLSNPVPANPAEETEIEANGAVHNFAIAHMYGAGADPARLDAYADALDAEAQHFIGSGHGDTYTGTAFDDIIEGAAGDDRLGGGGSSDEIDGGAGNDTIVFAGSSAGYEMTRNDAGVVTVLSDGGETTVANAEQIEFADRTVAVADIPVEGAAGMITIDASGSDGLDLTAYLAAFFAGIETNGMSSYHGGTEDAPFGYLNGDQVSFKYRDDGDATGPFTSVALLEGEEIAYDAIHYPDGGYPHGSVSGTVDRLVFGTIEGTEPQSGSALFTGYDAELVISGLGIHDDPGAGGSNSSNLVPTLYYGLRSGNVADIEAILADYAQSFLGSAGADTTLGSRFDDTATGAGGGDVLSGGAGDDGLTGGKGKDRLGGDDGTDALEGGKGNDRLFGGDGDDLLAGGKGKDKLRGEDGVDVLDGGRAKDKLFGGAGADTFVFASLKDSAAKGSGRDVIDDFTRSDGDLIDLSGLGKLDFIGKKQFSGDGGEVRFDKNKGTTLVSVDRDGDGKSDLGIKIDKAFGLHDSDFIL